MISLLVGCELRRKLWKTLYVASCCLQLRRRLELPPRGSAGELFSGHCVSARFPSICLQLKQVPSTHKIHDPRNPMTMKFLAVISLGLMAVGTSAIELTPDNWDAETAGKTVFIKFFAPWCGHCKKLKPDWDKLMDAFAGSKTQLVADVDCTAEGKPLCDANGVRGYPTLKWGDPSALEDYKGAREYSALKSFAEENLKPICSPVNIDLCDDAKKAEITKFMAMPDSELDAAIAAKEAELETAESNFKDEVQKLQEAYQKLMTDKDATIEKVKASGLGLMKAVKGSKKNKGSDEL